MVYNRKIKTRQEAKKLKFEFIEVWYNRKRLHSSIDYMTSEEREINQLAAA